VYFAGVAHSLKIKERKQQAQTANRFETYPTTTGGFPLRMDSFAPWAESGKSSWLQFNSIRAKMRWQSLIVSSFITLQAAMYDA
jgi:hypothetical protein